MKVEFRIDVVKDAKNYYDCANSKSEFGKDFTKCIKQEMVQLLRVKKQDDIKNDLLEILNRGYENDLDNFREKLKKIEKIGGDSK